MTSLSFSSLRQKLLRAKLSTMNAFVVILLALGAVCKYKQGLFLLSFNVSSNFSLCLDNVPALALAALNKSILTLKDSTV